jgi:hypothetical protein
LLVTKELKPERVPRVQESRHRRRGARVAALRRWTCLHRHQWLLGRGAPFRLRAWARRFRFPWRQRPCRGPSLTYPRPRMAVPRKPCCLLDGGPAQALLPLAGDLLLPGSALQVRLRICFEPRLPKYRGEEEHRKALEAGQSSRSASPTHCKISGPSAPRSPSQRTTARCS